MIFRKKTSRNEILISAVVVCQNEEKTIGRALLSLSFCDEIIVVDSFSKDRTVEIAKKTTEKIYFNKYKGCNSQKEFGRLKACGKWILNLDADEEISPELRKEIELCVGSERFKGYQIPVKTFVADHWLKHNGYFPGLQKRLFLKEFGYWNTKTEPHDKVILTGKWGYLQAPINHYTAQNLQEVEAKAIANGKFAASKLHKTGSKIYPLAVIVRPYWRFVRSFIFKAGILDRQMGYDIARIHALEGKIKYETLQKLNG